MEQDVKGSVVQTKMKSYDTARPLYLETGASGFGLEPDYYG